jgi:hypothetical protein
MASQRISGDRVGRSSVDEVSSRVHAKRSAAVSGSSTGIARTPRRRREPEIRTRPTVRLLTLRGLEPAEAANLTAYLCGIPVTEVTWKLREINQLLFLRELQRTGRFGPTDGAH